MRVLFTCPSGFSHLRSTLSLAEGLEQAGHEVAYATSASFVPAIRSAGYRAFAAGRDYQESKPDTFPELFSAAPAGNGLTVFAALAGQGVVEDLDRVIDEWRPGLVIRNLIEFGGWLAAERAGLPVATMTPSIDLPAPVLVSFTGDLLTHELPLRYGLEPDPQLKRLYSYPYLSTLPAEMTPSGFPPPPRVFRLRDHRVELGRDDQAALPEWAKTLGSRPLVHVAFGTIFGSSAEARKINEMVFAALAPEPVDVILAIGPENDPDDYGPRPENVRIVRHINAYRAFFERCDVLVNNAGPGTLKFAMAAGVPVCLMPFHAEGPMIARQIHSLGAGLLCTGIPEDRRPFPAVDLDRLRPEHVRDNVRRLLTDREFAGRMAGLGRQAGSLASAADAVPWLMAAVQDQPQGRSHPVSS
ncbi:MAG: glycosyltransferase [Actinomycetota bacterium]|nr:glycosyltransferase [Actinomycetota bacterium]